ncbi:MAG: hypothetical protein U0414_14670 [Polyangiaceae bacterium]
MNSTLRPPLLFGLLLTLASLASTGCGEGALRAAIATADTCLPGQECGHAGFDAPVAVGAVVHPDFQMKIPGSAGASHRYVSVSPSVLEVDDGDVVGRSEGTSALMLVTDGDTVVDFIHVWVKAPTKLRLAATVPGREKAMVTGGPIELLVGDAIFVSAVLSADGQRLIGSAPGEWSADEGVLSILREGNEDRRRVVALRPGKTELSLATLGLEASIDVVVRANAVESRGRPL